MKRLSPMMLFMVAGGFPPIAPGTRPYVLGSDKTRRRAAERKKAKRQKGRR